jgi:hypothetical protein
VGVARLPPCSWGSLRHRTRLISPSTCAGALLSARVQRLSPPDAASRRDALGAAVHDMELLAALVVTGLGFRVAVDDLDHPLGVLELLLLLLIALMGNLLLAFPLAGRHAVAA